MYRKYTSKEKLNIVEGYLNGIFSLEEKAHELGYKRAPGCFWQWVRQYQEQGADQISISNYDEMYALFAFDRPEAGNHIDNQASIIYSNN